MHQFQSNRIWAQLSCVVAGLSWLLHLNAAAATLSLTGITEGSQITLAPSASATNLTLSAVPSSGSPLVGLTLERSGAVFMTGTVSTPYSMTFSNLSSGKYFLTAAIVGDPASATDVSFDVRPASLQPPNDLWGQALSIAADAVAVLGTNAYATSEPGESFHADNGGGRSLWWKWTANSNGPIAFTTRGSTFDTVLAVYAGTNVSGLKAVAANDDAGSTNRSSQVTFTAVAGTTYYTAVDGALLSNGQSASGVASLTAFAGTAPTVSILFPTNGLSLRVATMLPTNLNATAAVTDAAGIQRVEFALDGAGLSLTGSLNPPYQWPLENLPPGDFLLTVTAVNNLGLLTGAHASFSIISTAPSILLVDAPSYSASGFQFAVTGLKGTSYELQSASNVPNWNPLTLWTNFDGAQRVLDTNSPQFSSRFYRVTIP